VSIPWDSSKDLEPDFEDFGAEPPHAPSLTKTGPDAKKADAAVAMRRLAHGDALQFDAFRDTGFVRDNRVALALSGTTLMSAGDGAHYRLGRFIDFRVENGWQLRREPVSRIEADRARLRIAKTMMLSPRSSALRRLRIARKLLHDPPAWA
jgi:hypothetical protein